jgi:hypothetical protein
LVLPLVSGTNRLPLRLLAHHSPFVNGVVDGPMLKLTLLSLTVSPQPWRPRSPAP